MKELEKLIYKRLDGKFIKLLFKASLLQLEYKNNPIRYNSFAVSFRELVRHIFYELAPDEDIKKCNWYVANCNARNGITRAQRIEYAIRGGLSDNFLNDELNIDLKTLTKKILKSIDMLNKYTHIEEDVFQVPENDGDKVVKDTMQALMNFFTHIDELKNNLISEYENILFDVIQNIFYEETFSEIDILSTQYRINEVVLDNIEIESIDSSEISIKIFGTLDVEHQYGSDRDVSNGDGDVFSNSYGFYILNKINVLYPKDVSIGPNDINIDTSNF